MIKLQRAHGAAVDALIAVLADPQRRASMRPSAPRWPPCAATRSIRWPTSSNAPTRASWSKRSGALAEMRATQATVYLYAPALAEESDLPVREPARAAIRQLQGSFADRRPRRPSSLYDLARSYFAGKQPISVPIFTAE